MGEGRDGYRDQIVTCDVDVSLHSKTHSLLMKYSNGTITQCYAYHYPSLFPVLFLQSLYVPFNSKNFSFTCPHSFFTCSKQIACLLLLLRQPRSEFFNVRGKIQSVGLCTQYSNEMCAPFAPVLTEVQILAVRMFSHTILPWVRKL